METVTTQDITVNDLDFNLNYNPDICIMCGSCVAQCSFNAIEVAPQVRKHEDKEGSKAGHKKKILFVIRQKADLAYACVGCGMCVKVCPNQALKVEINPNSRKNLLARTKGVIKRGGRAKSLNLRTLDKIMVGRISQMTDPALDAERHTFDLRAPLGRILKPKELPFKVCGENLTLEKPCPPVRWIYPLLFSDMSIGAISTRAWDAIALACAYLNEECHLPVRMCSGEGGLPEKLLRSEQLKYMLLQIGSGHFGWNRIIKSRPYMRTDPAGLIIKIGQGAKPGDGGLLPQNKVAPHIQAIRGVPETTLHSPPTHQGLYSIEESVQKMHLSLNVAFGFRVPVVIKCAASLTSVAVYNNLLRDPYHIVGGFFLDGLQGGTGAACEISLEHTGHPIVSKLRDCYLTSVAQGLQGQIPLWVGGGVGLTGQAAADCLKLVCLGANGVFVGKILLQLLGCVGDEHGRCNQCHTGKCPAGICTQDPRLIKRLDIDRGAEAIVNYVLTFNSELKKLLAPIGNSSLPVGRSDALISSDYAVAKKLDIAYAC
ncbi:MAG: 4Fe-4S binding protein [Desulfovibrionaceae bacterium]|nr:4Fe-4S binding protein [Desulfovibrionaceae bacterium]